MTQAVVAAQCRLLEADYEEYGGNDATGAAFCRSSALIYNISGILKMKDNEGDDDAFTMFSPFLLWAAGFLLLCNMMACIFSIVHRRRQRGSSLNCHSGGSVHPAISPGPCPSVHHRPGLPDHSTS